MRKHTKIVLMESRKFKRKNNRRLDKTPLLTRMHTEDVVLKNTTVNVFRVHLLNSYWQKSPVVDRKAVEWMYSKLLMIAPFALNMNRSLSLNLTLPQLMIIRNRCKPKCITNRKIPQRSNSQISRIIVILERTRKLASLLVGHALRRRPFVHPRNGGIPLPLREYLFLRSLIHPPLGEGANVVKSFDLSVKARGNYDRDWYSWRPP